MILHFPLLYRTNDGAFVMQPSRDSLNYLGTVYRGPMERAAGAAERTQTPVAPRTAGRDYAIHELFVGDSWVKRKGLAASASADPSPFIFAWAGFEPATFGDEGKSTLHTDQRDSTGTNNDGDLRGDEVIMMAKMPSQRASRRDVSTRSES